MNVVIPFHEAKNRSSLDIPYIMYPCEGIFSGVKIRPALRLMAHKFACGPLKLTPSRPADFKATVISL